MVVSGLVCIFKGRATRRKGEVKGPTHRDELKKNAGERRLKRSSKTEGKCMPFLSRNPGYAAAKERDGG